MNNFKTIVMNKDKQKTNTQEREIHEQDTMKKSSPEDMSGAQRPQEGQWPQDGRKSQIGQDKSSNNDGAPIRAVGSNQSGAGHKRGSLEHQGSDIGHDSHGKAFSSDNSSWKNE